jgi:hypothetical protein
VSSVSNCLYFLTLPLVSEMRVISTSKGMLKKFGVRVLSIEKYGICLSFKERRRQPFCVMQLARGSFNLCLFISKKIAGQKAILNISMTTPSIRPRIFCIDNARVIYTKKSLLLARHVFRNNSCVLIQ